MQCKELTGWVEQKKNTQQFKLYTKVFLSKCEIERKNENCDDDKR